MLLIFILLNLGTSTISTSTSARPCSEESKKVSDPENCMRYYLCINQYWKNQDCPKNYKFDNDQGKCIEGGPCNEIKEKNDISGRYDLYYPNSNQIQPIQAVHNDGDYNGRNQAQLAASPKYFYTNHHVVYHPYPFHPTLVLSPYPQYQIMNTQPGIQPLMLSSPNTNELGDEPMETSNEIPNTVENSPVELKWKDILPKSCGIFGKVGNRVIGGIPAAIESNPWQVALVESNSRVIHCGGSIISKSHIITAAHCLVSNGRVANIYDYLVYVGNVDVREPKAAYRIKNLFVNKVFTEKAFNGDIAMIMIEGRFQWSPEVYPICLPDVTSSYTAGRSCRITGWGMSEKSRSELILQTTVIKLTSKEQCEMNNKQGFPITPAMFCAGDFENGGVGACYGDSGGPLTCVEDGKAFLFGVTSWGMICGKAGYPSVYAKVSKFISWIQRHLEISTNQKQYFNLF